MTNTKRAAEKDVDAAWLKVTYANCELELERRYEGLDSAMYRVALRTFDRAISTHADAVKNLQKTSCEEEN